MRTQTRFYTDTTARKPRGDCPGCGRRLAPVSSDPLCTRCRALPSFAKWFDQVSRPQQ